MFNTNTIFFSMNGRRKYPLQVLQKPYIETHLPIVSNNIILVSQIEEQSEARVEEQSEARVEEQSEARVEEQSEEIIVYELYDHKVEKDMFEQQIHPYPQMQEPVIEMLSIPVKTKVEELQKVEEVKYIYIKEDEHDNVETVDKKINAYGPSSVVGDSVKQTGKNKKKNTKNVKNSKL